MIKRLKADSHLYLRKRPLAFLTTCCSMCSVFVCLSITFEKAPEGDDGIPIEVFLSNTEGHAIAEPLVSASRTSQEQETIHLFLIVCKRLHGNHPSVVSILLTSFYLVCSVIRPNISQAEESARQVVQAATLLKTIYLITSSSVSVVILNNDMEMFNRIMKQLEEWKMNIDNNFR